MTRSGLSRIFWIGAAAFVVAAPIAFTAVVEDSLSDSGWKILLTVAVLLLAGATTFGRRSAMRNGKAVA